MFETKLLIAGQENLRMIAEKYAGTTKSLTYLRQQLAVKDFAQLVNCFTGLRRFTVDEEVKEDSEESGILIAFVETDGSLSSFGSNGTAAASTCKMCPHDELVDSYSSDFSSEREDSEDDDLAVPSKFNIKEDSFTLLKKRISEACKHTIGDENDECDDCLKADLLDSDHASVNSDSDELEIAKVCKENSQECIKLSKEALNVPEDCPQQESFVDLIKNRLEEPEVLQLQPESKVMKFVKSKQFLLISSVVAVGSLAIAAYKFNK